MTTSNSLPPFHLAFPVRDLAQARAFYGDLLGCPEGRSSAEWVDFNFYGHQIAANLPPDECGHKPTSSADAHDLPVPHSSPVPTPADRQRLAHPARAAGRDKGWQ